MYLDPNFDFNENEDEFLGLLMMATEEFEPQYFQVLNSNDKNEVKSYTSLDNATLISGAPEFQSTQGFPAELPLGDMVILNEDGITTLRT